MSARRLEGRTILVTRPEAQAAGLARRLEALGATVVVAPVIRIAEPASYKALDNAIRKLDEYDLVIFTSPNAVERFFSRAGVLGFRPLKRPSRRASCAAIGPKTAATLRDCGWRPAIVPSLSTSEALARAIGDVARLRILIPRARKAREALPALLRRRGARVDVVEAYRTIPDARGAARLRRLADRGAIDAVTFTSASTVASLADQLGARRWRRLFSRAAAASIGPITSSALRELGVRPVQAARSREASLAAAVARRLSA